MFTEEDEHYDEEEMDEDDFEEAEDDQNDSQLEDEEQETYFVGISSKAQKSYNPPPNCSRPIYKNRYNLNRRQAPYYPMNCDRSRSNSRIQKIPPRTQISTQQAQAFRYKGCNCPKCKQLTVDTKD